MKIKPLKGMNDYLPDEVEFRDYLQVSILKTYQKYGFQKITTPMIEDIENLDKSEGGENLGLMFKILKRGNKLEKALQTDEQLCDMGLRYDLTLPLSRYYANNKQKLMSPFKSIQIDRVYRAEQPQQGRLREFIQCDIDILGDDSYNAEIELIYVTAQALLSIGISDFNIKINDKKILNSILSLCGFEESEYETVCISLDKLKKIGIDGVQGELSQKLENSAAIAKFIGILSEKDIKIDRIQELISDTNATKSFNTIINSLTTMSNNKFTITYDFSLVRGQGYYTGTVFEIESNEYNCSIAGGGRYDNLIGKFSNENIPAVGFSIGFERIYSLLKGKQTNTEKRQKTAVIYYCDFCYAICFSEKIPNSSVFKATKKTGKLISRLEENGYDKVIIISEDKSVKEIDFNS